MRSWSTVILDEQGLFRDLLCRLLQQERGFRVVGQAGCSCEGLALCREHQPDLVVLDFQMPRIGGDELARSIARECPSARILALTGATDDYTVHRVTECRVAGCMEKNQPLEMLRTAMSAVASGGMYFSPCFTEAGAALAADPAGFPKYLSRREQEILSNVAEGWTSRVIGRKLGLSARTVETHRHHIMQKLGLGDFAALMRFAVHHGFREHSCPRPAGGGPCA